MSQDLRNYKKQTNFRLILGGLFLLFVVGGGFVLLFYGPAAAVSALICLASWAGVILLIAAIFWLIDWVVKRANRE